MPKGVFDVVAVEVSEEFDFWGAEDAGVGIKYPVK
jgi:hypothetical protein